MEMARPWRLGWNGRGLASEIIRGDDNGPRWRARANLSERHLKICFVIPGQAGKLFSASGCFPSVRETARFCRARCHEVTILFADADAGAGPGELKSWSEEGFAVYSLAAGKFRDREPFFPNLLRNSWLAYQWLKLRDFDRILFRDDSSAGLISFAAKRLGEAFSATGLIFHLNGPASWSAHLRDRRQLVRDDLTLSYSVQYGVENADQLIVPAEYFLERIRQAGWIPATRVSVLPYLSNLPVASRVPSTAQPGLRLVYPLHDSDHAPLAIFLQAVSVLARDGRDLRISFLCHGDAKERRNVSKRVRQVMTAANATSVPWEVIDGAAELPAWCEAVVWLFSPLWLKLPFLILETANRGEALLVADTPESRQIVRRECLADWVPKELKARLARCLEGDLPHPAGIPRETAEQAWNEALFEFPAQALPPPGDELDEIRVSVCVAHFNKARDLRESLDSLRAQSHRNLEVIVVDDCSTDPASQAAFEAAAAAFDTPDWKFIREEMNRGPGYARNRAVSVATGSHLVFFDADDVAFPDMVERLLRGLLRSGGACVAGSSRRLRETDGQCAIEGTSTYVGGSLENAFLYPPAGTVFIIAKDVFEAVGGFKTDLPKDCHEDWNFHVRLLAREYRLHVLPEPVFAYRSIPLSRSLLVPQDMALLVEPLLEGTPQMRKNLLDLTIEQSGAMESAVRLLADYEQFAGGIRFLRFLNRLKRSVLGPFRRRRKR
jgi:O-antigen biosynthesis protein